MSVCPQPQIVIACRALAVGYPGHPVLQGVDLDIEAGAFLPLVGANGAGKTTLLHTLAGLLPPQAGELRFDAGRHPPAFVPQRQQLDPFFPADLETIVGMGLQRELRRWRRPDAEQRQRLAAALERFGLTAHRHKTFAELSGGMRQKALLARAFVSRAAVYLLDEPTAELDEASAQELLAHLHRLSREDGRTVLLVHHGLDRVAALAGEVVLVANGGVRRQRLAALRPADRAAAGAPPGEGQP